MLRRVRDCVMMAPFLLAYAAGHATTLAPYPTAKVTVNGTEQSIGGSWDNANITIDFNGFLETVHYGQFSSDASLASALAAMFTRDYLSFGLYAKAGANSNTDPTVITFQLVNGSSFGPLNVTGPSTSFTFTPTGFAATPSGVPDQGVATLLFNGGAIATASYGDGSTPASIAQDLALKASSSLVTVTAEGPNVYLQSKQTGTYSDTYSLSFSTSASFSSSAGGTLSGSSETNSVPVYSYNLGYDVVGNVTTLNDSVMGNWSYANGYDDLNRLVSGQASTGPYVGQYLCWSYDIYGNRTNQSISNQPFVTTGSPCQATTGASLIATAVSYGTNNQISSVTSPALTVAYDGAGNVTNDGNNSYLYDAEGRICAVNGPQGMTGYQYDAAGNRVGRGSITTMSCDVTQNGYHPASDFVLDLGGGQMTEVSVGNGQSTPQHTNVTANGILIATIDTIGRHFYVNDALGSRRVQTDPAGFPEQTCQNLPFGDQLYCTGSLTTPTEHHFTGKERDTESGLDYFGARYYASLMGRWMSPDWADKAETIPYAKLDDPQTLNLYEYVRNNPLGITDIDGHGWWDKFKNVFGDAACWCEGQEAERKGAEFRQRLADSYKPMSAAEKKELIGYVTITTFYTIADTISGSTGTDSSAEVESGESTGLATVGGRNPVNSQYAGGTHPSGVEFSEQGFPDFGRHAVAEVEIEGLTGNYAKDSAMANQAVGIPSTPDGYTWHHVEDGKTMQLIPSGIHSEVRHTGGAAVIRNGGVDPK